VARSCLYRAPPNDRDPVVSSRVTPPPCGCPSVTGAAARFCGRCGAPLEGDDRPGPTAGSRRSRWSWRTAALVVVAVASIAGMVALAGSGRTTGSFGEFADEVAVPVDVDDRSPPDAVELPDDGAALAPPERGLVCRPNDCAAWSLELPRAASVLPVGDLLVTVEASRATAHELSLGEPRWSIDTGPIFAPVASPDPVVADADGALLLHERGQLARLDPRDGDVLWHVDLGTRWVERIGRTEGRVVVTTGDRLRGRSRPLPTTLVGLDAERGTIRWQRRILEVLDAPEPARSVRSPTIGGEAVAEPDRRRLTAPAGVLAVALDTTTIGGIDVVTGDTVWQRAAAGGEVVGEVAGDRVVLRGGNGRTLLLDGATGTSLTDLGDTVAGLTAIGPLLIATSTDGRSSVVDSEGAVTDRRTGPPRGWTETDTDVFIAWEDDGWVLLVRYGRSGVPGGARRLPGRIGNWGGDLVLGAHPGSDRVRAVGVDGRTTVAVRTDGPTEPPPNPSVAPSGTRLQLIGRTIVARDDAGLTVQAPGGSVRVESGREVVAVAADGTVVVRGHGGLLAIGADRLGPVTPSKRPGRP